MMLKILAIIGFWLSFYVLHVKRKSRNLRNKNYRPACDINKNISCTKAFNSRYGKLIGIHNSIIGILFYPLIYILASANLFSTVFFLSVISVVFSFYLAYILYSKVKSFCIVCTSIYLINVLILIFSIKGL